MKKWSDDYLKSKLANVDTGVKDLRVLLLKLSTHISIGKGLESNQLKLLYNDISDAISKIEEQ